MRVAVFYTGMLRTIMKTIRYFKKNVLRDNVEVFACIQNDTSLSNAQWTKWLEMELGGKLKAIEWFDSNNYSRFNEIKKGLLENESIPSNWKNYLNNSGSIIEYQQLQLAYTKMFIYERKNQFKYDYVVRHRTDMVLGKPLDFHWLNLTKEDVNERLDKIKHHLNEHQIEATDNKLIYYFMTTLISDDLIDNIKNFIGDYIIHPSCNISLDSLYDYIRSGKYIMTLRQNLFYIVKREYFYWIPSLGSFYCCIDHPMCEPVYWFNAENQFYSACYQSNLSIFNYKTCFDDESLYEFNESKYFTEEYTIKNPMMLYCLVRY